MHDALWRMTQVDQYTMTVVVLLVATVFCLIRTVLDSFLMAVVFTPVMLVGGLAANFLFRTFYVPTTTDKDTEVVIASAVGVLAALVLMLLATWLTILMSDYRSRRRKPMALLPAVPADSAPVAEPHNVRPEAAIPAE